MSEVLKGSSRISPAKAKELERRSTSFARATQKKGMPMTYGTGKPPEKK